MGRPPIRARDLVGTGLLDLESIQRLARAAKGLSLGRLLYPCSRVWPMGFSWSSYIAQTSMLGVCSAAGLEQDRQLADDLPSPLSDLRFGLATDDIVLFDRSTPEACTLHASRIDKAFTRVGIQRHTAKDVTGVLDGSAVGIDLVKGLKLFGSAARIRLLLPALLGVLERKLLKPAHLRILLGIVQWLNLLARPLFSVLSACYTFAGLPDQQRDQELP
jgi:hypothetical protein